MRLNPFAPRLPPYPGPHQVGTIDVELQLPTNLQRTFGDSRVTTLLLRLFYPTSATRGRSPRWVGRGDDTVRGYAHFLGINPILLRAGAAVGLDYTEIPAFSDAPLLSPRYSNSEKGWPCMLFSHGLGGTRNAYSQICGSVASGGLIVAAVEHRDNSAAISVVHDQDGKEVEVVAYVSLKGTNAATIKKRRDQIAQRSYETRLSVEVLRSLGNGGVGVVPVPAGQERFKGFKDALDCRTQGRFIVAGHSFGAATAAGAAKDTNSIIPGQAEHPLSQEFRAAILLDPWMEVLADKMHDPLRVPTLAIASAAFQHWSTNWNALVRMLSDVPGRRLFWIKDSAHLTQSDFQLLFPTATKYAFKTNVDPQDAMGWNVRAIREFLRVNGVGDEAPDEEIFDVDHLVEHRFD